ncbi:MAG: 3-carboxy-cis,cis-muconate cycloisomerase [Rhizobiales bacterium]|nr:3-carboxy-cis,cis-muconate cycloisomerase [Hyphomicrobiales bacterium]MBN9009117.1 3-carboxy-cis,cis-muconate cycloisomerase [Hyphomicrobiales bacterium]
MSLTPFDHPWLSGLLGDDEVAAQFSAEADHEEMVYFEEALAAAEGAEGVIPAEAAEYIADHIGGFGADFEALAKACARDGVVVPEFVRQLREFMGPHGPYVHVGATSQDVVDTSLILRLRPVTGVFRERLPALDAALATLDTRFGANTLMGRTRMQDALPIRVADKVATWRGPLGRDLLRLDELLPRLLVLQFGGAVGTLDKLGDKGRAVAARMAEALGLGLPERSWHSQRDNLAEFAAWLALVTGSLGKLGADVALLAQMGEIALSGAGASSAMPHKQNPVAAEVLVALARHNAALVGSMHQALVHEQERSGAAWTLEWLTLPQMVAATAASLRTALSLVASIAGLGHA